MHKEKSPSIVPRGLNIPQASQYSGLTVWTIRQAIYNRRIEFLKEGRRYMILRDDLDRFLERQRYKVK